MGVGVRHFAVAGCSRSSGGFRPRFLDALVLNPSSNGEHCLPLSCCELALVIYWRNSCRWEEHVSIISFRISLTLVILGVIGENGRKEKGGGDVPLSESFCFGRMRVPIHAIRGSDSKWTKNNVKPNAEFVSRNRTPRTCQLPSRESNCLVTKFRQSRGFAVAIITTPLRGVAFCLKSLRLGRSRKSGNLCFGPCLLPF